MPLFVPFVLGALALSGIGLGTKKGYDGYQRFQEANRIADEARRRHERRKMNVEDVRLAVNADADNFGNFKLEVARDTLGDMVRLLDELKRRGRVSSFEALDGVDFPSGALIAEMREVSGAAKSLLEGVLVGAVKGSLTGAAVYGLAGSIGVASTGAAISGLAGVAAQSATLAWLGGGALAAGGFGMLGGAVILGGLVAAPVFLITGFTMAAKGEKALTEARRFEAEVKVAIETMGAMLVVMDQIRARIRELTEVITELRTRATEQLRVLWELVDRYNEHDASHSTMLAKGLVLCKGLADLLKVPVIEQDGSPNPALPGLIATYRSLNP